MDYNKLRIIIVDDDQTTRRIISRLVKQIGFKFITEAEDGEQALEILNNEPIDIILSDWDMPIVDGFKLLEMVRADKKYENIPFVMITANDDRDNIIKAAKARVSQYIIKPFTVQSLKAKIEKILGPDTSNKSNK